MKRNILNRFIITFLAIASFSFMRIHSCNLNSLPPTSYIPVETYITTGLYQRLALLHIDPIFIASGLDLMTDASYLSNENKYAYFLIRVIETLKPLVKPLNAMYDYINSLLKDPILSPSFHIFLVTEDPTTNSISKLFKKLLDMRDTIPSLIEKLEDLEDEDQTSVEIQAPLIINIINELYKFMLELQQENGIIPLPPHLKQCLKIQNKIITGLMIFLEENITLTPAWCETIKQHFASLPLHAYHTSATLLKNKYTAISMQNSASTTRSYEPILPLLSEVFHYACILNPERPYVELLNQTTFIREDSVNSKRDFEHMYKVYASHTTQMDQIASDAYAS